MTESDNYINGTYDKNLELMSEFLSSVPYYHDMFIKWMNIKIDTI